MPLWSDRFGLGIPLLAESHVAAFYPPNWLIYSIAGISTAYRMAMWLHYLLLAAATYAYARFLRISPHGAAIAALAFTFCGFQAIHSTHEPFYHALPYLTLAVLVAEWYLCTGRLLGIILLAVTWGAQLTLGHFQLQMWTAALVLLLGTWRAARDGLPRRRVLGLILALGWGAALAGVQLLSSWELARFVGFTHRSFSELAFFAFPPAHWAELAIPGFLRGIPSGPEAPYWYEQGTSGYEACFSIGTMPLLLAFLVLGGGRSDGRLAPWLCIIAVSLILAVLPRGWPAAYAVVLEVPGFGWFRAGALRRAVQPGPLPGCGYGVRPRGRAGFNLAGHGHGLGLCDSGRGLGGLLVASARSSCRAGRPAVGSGRRLRRTILGRGHCAFAGVAPAPRPGLGARAGHGRGAWMALLHCDHRLGMGR